MEKREEEAEMRMLPIKHYENRRMEIKRMREKEERERKREGLN